MHCAMLYMCEPEASIFLGRVVSCLVLWGRLAPVLNRCCGRLEPVCRGGDGEEEGGECGREGWKEIFGRKITHQLF